MAKEFFNRDVEFFLDHRVDWARYFRLARGSDANWREEVETYRMVLRTAGEICESIEAGARDHWHEHVVLKDGEGEEPESRAHLARPHSACSSALRSSSSRWSSRSRMAVRLTKCGSVTVTPAPWPRLNTTTDLERGLLARSPGCAERLDRPRPQPKRLP